MPQSRIDSATRVISARTPDSRSAVPISPCRYFDATMLVAVIDQSAGDLHVLLLEDQLALPVLDHGVAQLPLHLVVRGDARAW